MEYLHLHHLEGHLETHDHIVCRAMMMQRLGIHLFPIRPAHLSCHKAPLEHNQNSFVMMNGGKMTRYWKNDCGINVELYRAKVQHTVHKKNTSASRASENVNNTQGIMEIFTMEDKTNDIV
jgi:hypothetical protein